MTKEITKTLVTSGNQPVLAANQPVSALKPGQIGFFDFSTNKTFAANAVPAQFYVAVGEGSGSDLEDVRRSLGFRSFSDRIEAYSKQCAVGGVDKVVEISDLSCVECNSNYAVRLNIVTPAVWVEYGFQPYTKTISFGTKKSICCTEGDCKDAAKKIRDGINADGDGIFRAYVTTTGNNTELTDAQIDALADGVCPAVRVTASAVAYRNFCHIPNENVYPREIDFDITLDGFDCCGTVTTVTELVITQGLGHDLNLHLYNEAGWSGGGPYRQTQTGIDLGGNIQVPPTAKYTQVSLAYTQKEPSGFDTHETPQTLVLAIPTTDTATLAAVVGYTNAIAADFEAQSTTC